MRLEDITPVILTLDEEPNIGRCLDALRWASEVVVLDSFSSDLTAEIARTYSNVRLAQRSFDDHTSQWNHAISLPTTGWVLSLDADYILSGGFCRELENLSHAEATDAWLADFHYCIFGRELRASLYPPRAVLFRRDRCHYVQDGHTQLLAVPGDTGRLESVILHDDRKPLASWLRSQIRYSQLEAEHLLATPAARLNRADRLRLRVFAAPLLVFFYTMLGKGLILEGMPGWYYVMQRTLAEIMLSLQLLHKKLESCGRKQSPGPSE
jgi:glycosyltransferase involved in cell wall biosynthesis